MVRRIQLLNNKIFEFHNRISEWILGFFLRVILQLI